MEAAYSVDVIPITHHASTVVTFERALLDEFIKIVPKTASFFYSVMRHIYV